MPAHGHGTVLELLGHWSGLFVALIDIAHPASNKLNASTTAFIAEPSCLRRTVGI